MGEREKKRERKVVETERYYLVPTIFVETF